MIDEVRRGRGEVFSALRRLCELTNTAWYHVEDKQALTNEHIQGLQAVIRDAQKEINAWIAREVQ